mgnify:CR=1 FL=1
MSVDYATLSDDELEAIASNDYSKLSDSTLNALVASTPAPKETKTLGVDYGSLSDSELEAIANNDYSKLSDATLNAMAAESNTAVTPGASVAPQGVSVVKEILSNAPALASGAGDLAKRGIQAAGNMSLLQGARVLADTGSMLAGHPPYATMLKMATDTSTGTPIKEAFGTAVNAVKGSAGALGRGVAATGGVVARGLLAPESALLMPYQMAAYEQEKIRANPNAPEYATNPYAQSYRGEFPTQGAAGAANRRQAVATAPSGYTLTPQEAGNLLSSGDERTISTFGGRKRLQEIIAGSVQAQAASRILPVKPSGF